MTQTFDDPWRIRPPAWMNRAEKRYFRQLIDVRKEADDPLSESEIDTLADYISGRSRIEELRQMWKRASAEADGQCGHLDCKRALAIGRQIDAMTKLSRRIAGLLRI